MAGVVYYKHFPRDWITGCIALSLEEEGLYCRCINFMYDSGKPIPLDDKAAAAMLHVNVLKYRKVMTALLAAGKLLRAESGIINGRVFEELAAFWNGQKARSQTAKKREAAKRKFAAEDLIPAEVSGGHTPPVTPPVTPPDTRGVTPPVTPPDTGVVIDGKFNGINAKKADDCQTLVKPLTINHEPEIKETTTTARARGAADDGFSTKEALDGLEAKLVTAANGCLASPASAPQLMQLSDPLFWIREGCDLEMDILPTLRSIGAKKHGKQVRSWNFFTEAVFESRDRRIRRGPELPQVLAEGGRPRGAWRPGR